MRWILLMLLLSPPHQDVDALIAALSHEDPSVRDKAVGQLISAGEKALPALRRAAESRDLDVASRARAALYRIELTRKAKLFSHTLSPELLKVAPEIVDPLAGASEEELLTLVTDLRGIAEGPSMYVGAQYDIKAELLVPVFRIIWDAIEEAREKGAPMRRLEPVFLSALRWRSGQLGGASGGSSITINAVPPDRLIAVYMDGPNSRNMSVLEALLNDNPPYDSVKQVRAMIDSSDANTRRVGAALAGRIGDRASIARLRELLKDPDARLAATAADSLGRMADVASAPLIAPILESGNRNFSYRIRPAAEALLKLEAYGQVDALLEAAEGMQGYYRGKVVQGLVRMRSEKVVPHLKEWADEAGNWNLQLAVIEALAVFRPEGYAAMLDEMIEEAQPHIRHQVARALARLQDHERLAKLAEGTSGYYRSQILTLQAEHGISGVDDRIREEFDTADWALVRMAGDRGLKDLAPQILELVDEDNTSIGHAAVRALGKLGTEHFGQKAAEWLRSESEAFRAVVLEAAAEAGTGLKVEEILPHLEVPETRAAAMRALAKIDPKGTPDRLKEFLEHKNPDARMDAVEVLAEFDEADAVKRARALLKAPAEEARRRAAQWLAEQDDASGAEILAADVRSPDRTVRRRAVDLLARLRHPSAGLGLHRRMLSNDDVPILLNAVARPEVWKRYAEMKIPDGAPTWPTVDELAAWLTDRGIPVRWDKGVRASFKTDRLKVGEENVAELLERIHGLSGGTRVRLEADGTVLLESNLTARRAWFAWFEKQN